MQKELNNFSYYGSERIKSISLKHPSADVGIIGRSILGRDIDYFKFGRGRRHILATGAHSGREYITSCALFEFVDFVLEKSARGAAYCNINLEILLQLFTFWIVPCINPDGAALCVSGAGKTPLRDRQLRMNGGEDFSNWCSNARGVELSHNYAFGFAEYKRLERGAGISAGASGFSGEYPESEPETKSLANLVRTLMPSLVISLNAGNDIIRSRPDSDGIGRITRRIAKEIGCSAAPSADACGGFCDYTGGLFGIPSFSVEISGGENADFKSVCDRVRKLLILLPTYL